MALSYLHHPPDPLERQLRQRLEGLGVRFNYGFDAHSWTVGLWLPSVLAFAERQGELRAVLAEEVPAWMRRRYRKTPSTEVIESYFEVEAGVIDPAERALLWQPPDDPYRPVLRVPLGQPAPEQAVLVPALPNGFWAFYYP